MDIAADDVPHVRAGRRGHRGGVRPRPRRLCRGPCGDGRTHRPTGARRALPAGPVSGGVGAPLLQLHRLRLDRPGRRRSEAPGPEPAPGGRPCRRDGGDLLPALHVRRLPRRPVELRRRGGPATRPDGARPAGVPPADGLDAGDRGRSGGGPGERPARHAAGRLAAALRVGRRRDLPQAGGGGPSAPADAPRGLAGQRRRGFGRDSGKPLRGRLLPGDRHPGHVDAGELRPRVPVAAHASPPQPGSGVPGQGADETVDPYRGRRDRRGRHERVPGCPRPEGPGRLRGRLVLPLHAGVAAVMALASAIYFRETAELRRTGALERRFSALPPEGHDRS